MSKLTFRTTSFLGRIGMLFPIVFPHNLTAFRSSLDIWDHPAPEISPTILIPRI